VCACTPNLPAISAKGIDCPENDIQIAAENLPWIFWRKRRRSRVDFDERLPRVEADPARLRAL